MKIKYGAHCNMEPNSKSYIHYQFDYMLTHCNMEPFLSVAILFWMYQVHSSVQNAPLDTLCGYKTPYSFVLNAL